MSDRTNVDIDNLIGENSAVGTFVDGVYVEKDTEKVEVDAETSKETVEVETVDAPTTQDNDDSNDNEVEETVETDKTDVEIDENTSLEQSKDKNHPANKAFAKVQHELKSSNDELKLLRKQLAEKDGIFENLAKEKGFDNIKTAEGYAAELKKGTLMAKYEETKDPKYLLEIQKSEIMAEFKSLLSQNSLSPEDTAKAKYEEAEANDISEFNEEFGTKLVSLDDVNTLPNASKIIEKLKIGYTLSDAHSSVNRKIIVEEQVKAAKQSIINKSKGFDHVKQNATKNTNKSDTVTDSEIESNYATYEFFNPNMTKKQIINEIAKGKKAKLLV